MQVLKLLACASLIAFVSTTGAFAAEDQKSPNCSPGEKGCSANYPTSDVSKTNPAASKEMSPNCSPGEKGCSANAPTSNVTKANPAK